MSPLRSPFCAPLNIDISTVLIKWPVLTTCVACLFYPRIQNSWEENSAPSVFHFLADESLTTTVPKDQNSHFSVEYPKVSKPEGNKSHEEHDQD